MTIKRGDRVTICKVEEGYEVRSYKSDNLLLSADESYNIYFKNINFNPNGTMTAKYLGDTDGKLIHRDAKEILFDGKDWIQEDNKTARTARMVVLNNVFKKVVVVIPSA